MILHCTPPSEEYAPNPALGYLKGFLQAHDIEVKNVYWNVILARQLWEFQRDVRPYAEDTRFFPVLVPLYIARHLITDDFSGTTPLDLIFLSVFPKEELSEMMYAVKDSIDRYIKQQKLHEDVIAGFTLKIYQWPMSFYIISRLKELNPDITIVVGGITTKSQAAAVMRAIPQADYAIYGEGEYPLLHVVKALKTNQRINVPNLHCVIHKGNIMSTRVTHEYPDLDSYPFADHADYFETVRKYMRVLKHPITIPIWGSRSCSWNKCKFCVLNEGYHYRVRSPENVVKEVEHQSDLHHVSRFIFVDTEFAGTMQRFKTLLTLLIKSAAEKKKQYEFCAEISPLFITAETAPLMHTASFTKVQAGFEAMTDTLLEKMQKQQRVVHNIQALKLGSQYNLGMHGLNIIREIPTETEEDIVESCKNIQYIRFFLNKYPLILGYLKLWKGAPFYEDVPEEERKKWRENPFWAEIAPAGVVPDDDRFEFFGFYRTGHNPQWDVFDKVLHFVTRQEYTYEWVEYPDGSSVEEKGAIVRCYVFDRDETDFLVFCDMIKTFSEIKKRFNNLSEDELLKMLQTLKDAGMIYYDKDLNCISVLEAAKRRLSV